MKFRLKNIYVIIPLMMIVSNIMLTSVCFASIGVKPGDWARYKIEVDLEDRSISFTDLCEYH